MAALSSGLLISLVFIDFLPHALLKGGSAAAFSIASLSALIFVLFIEARLIPNLKFLNRFLDGGGEASSECSHYHQHHHHPFSHPSSSSGLFSAMGCLLICAFFDGLRLASSILIHQEAFGVSALAVFFHIIPEGAAVMGLSQSSKLSHRYFPQVLFCSFLALGIIVTGILRLQFSPSIILSFSAVTILYVSFVHLLPIAFSKGNQKWFLLSLVLSGLVLIFFQH